MSRPLQTMQEKVIPSQQHVLKVLQTGYNLAPLKVTDALTMLLGMKLVASCVQRQNFNVP